MRAPLKIEQRLLDGRLRYIETHKLLTSSRTIVNSLVMTFLYEVCTMFETSIGSVKA
jgi:hypothetical protein